MKLKNFTRGIIIIVFLFMIFNVTINKVLSQNNNSESETDELEIYLNNEKLEFDDVSPVIEDGRTLVPFRKLAESIGVEVDWIAEKEKIIAESEILKFTMTVGSNMAYLNEIEIQMDVSPKIIEGRTLIPLRRFSETFDVNVDYINGEIYMTQLEKLELKDKTLSGFYTLGYEGRSSWEELFQASYPDVKEDSRVRHFNNIHLGWFEVSDEGNLISSGERYGFRRPAGYENVLENLADKGINRNLTIIANQKTTNTGEKEVDLKEIFEDKNLRANLIEEIIEELNKDDYTGVNLDIEELGLGNEQEEINEIRENYVNFVSELADKMNENHELVITVHPPNSVYKGYDYEKLGEIADKLVLMAYDYHDRNLPSHTAPLDKVEDGIEQLKEKVPGNQIVLGVRFPAVKYQEAPIEQEEPDNLNGAENFDELDDNEVLPEEEIDKDPLEEKEVTEEWIISNPYLDSVYQLKEEKNLGKKWDPFRKVNYLNFETEDGSEIYIYMESERSLLYKWSLIIDYDLKGASFWRIGAVPDFVYEQVDEIYR